MAGTIAGSDNQFRIIGTRPIRHDGEDKVTGRAKYGADYALPGMLHGKVLRSPHAHARIKSINIDKALKHPGVRAIITGADLPEVKGVMTAVGELVVNTHYLSLNVMARDKVLYDGHPVAAVGPALAADQPGAAQLGQDGLKERARDILRAGELLPGDVAAGRGGQLDRGTQRVVGPSGHSHDKYYPSSRSK